MNLPLAVSDQVLLAAIAAVSTCVIGYMQYRCGVKIDANTDAVNRLPHAIRKEDANGHSS